jgi:Asparagine synthase (glutamine-hydrolyzing)
MCGIVGFSGNFHEDALLKAIKTIVHRGPDFCDTYFDNQNKIGLGHVRLSILDLSTAGNQPMISKTRKVIIVYNGEIYNFREIKENLKRRGYSFESNTDTEVILNLYLEYGTDMLPLLNGIFSFAIWDYEKNFIFIARDALGVKPLYYSKIPQGFYLW